MGELTIIIGTHGEFGTELKKSMEMIVGKTSNIYCLSLLPEKTFEDFLHEADDLLVKIKGPTLALVDLFGGTPSNVLTVLTKKYSHKVVSGLSLPMLIEVYLTFNGQENIILENVVSQCIENAKNGIICTNSQLEEEKENV